MSSTNSSGKRPNKPKEEIPIEHRNAREWDPTYRKEDHPSDEESDEDDDYWDEDEDYDYPIPYVSGGQTADGATVKGIPEVANLSVNVNPGRQPTSMDHSGFQTVSYKHSPRNPPKPNGSRPNASRRDGKSKSQQRARPKAVFPYNKDNLARAAYRKRQPHQGTFRLPRDPYEIEPTRGKMYVLLEGIGFHCHSFIRPPQLPNDRELLIWGNNVQVQNTIEELKQWLGRFRETEIRRPLAKEKFAREHSTISAQYRRMQNQMAKEAAIQKFQQVPEEARVFGCTGSFLWPVEEVRPEELLGSSLEALDPIRFEYQSHIIFDNKLSVFRILSDNSESVKQTLSRIEGIMKEFIAKSGRRTIEYIIEPPSSSAIRREICIIPGPNKIPTLTGKVLDRMSGDAWLQQHADMAIRNTHRIEQALRKTIANLPYYRGQLQMRIEFGTFALTQFKWSGPAAIPFEKFMENVASPGTKGTVIKDLYIKKDAATILDKICQADKLLQPIGNSIINLEDVTPSFGARFTFQELNKPTMLLEVEMNTASLDDIYEKTQALWTRADRRDITTLLDMFVIQVNGGSSYKVHISNEHTFDSSRITRKMTAFADSVKLKNVPKSNPDMIGQKVFKWEKDLPGTMHPATFEQKTAFRYRLTHNTDWVFEIARHDTYGDGRNQNTPINTRWDANLWNTNWDSILTSNAGLGIGQAAAWDPKLNTFFPNGHARADQGLTPGVQDFLNTVRIVTNFLDGLKKELPHLRN